MKKTPKQEHNSILNKPKKDLAWILKKWVTSALMLWILSGSPVKGASKISQERNKAKSELKLAMMEAKPKTINNVEFFGDPVDELYDAIQWAKTWADVENLFATRKANDFDSFIESLKTHNKKDAKANSISIVKTINDKFLFGDNIRISRIFPWTVDRKWPCEAIIFANSNWYSAWNPYYVVRKTPEGLIFSGIVWWEQKASTEAIVLAAEIEQNRKDLDTIRMRFDYKITLYTNKFPAKEDQDLKKDIMKLSYKDTKKIDKTKNEIKQDIEKRLAEIQLKHETLIKSINEDPDRIKEKKDLLSVNEKADKPIDWIYWFKELALFLDDLSDDDFYAFITYITNTDNLCEIETEEILQARIKEFFEGISQNRRNEELKKIWLPTVQKNNTTNMFHMFDWFRNRKQVEKLTNTKELFFRIFNMMLYEYNKNQWYWTKLSKQLFDKIQKMSKKIISFEDKNLDIKPRDLG